MLMSPPEPETQRRLALFRYLAKCGGKDVLTLANNEAASEAGMKFRAMGIEQLKIDVSYNICRISLGDSKTGK